MEGLTPEEEERLHKLLKLSPDTIARLEKVAKDDEVAERMWALVRRFAAGFAALVGALILFGEQVKAAVRFIVRGIGE